MSMQRSPEEVTARTLRSSWVTDAGQDGWMIYTIKGDQVALYIPTRELAEHIVSHHNMVVQEWHSLERTP